MEFPFDINHLFSERVTILDQTLGAGRVSPKRPNLQSHIVTVIDELGIASAKAQRLTTPVTSANKLQSQQHQVYLMKDGESNGGRGVIVGFLKVGYKKLFLLDQQGVHIEAEPLCVLDFFVAHNLQRHGYGLELFNFMLQDKNLEPVLMAYDRPSPKLLSFLAKHYCLTQSVPQVNHFVVFDGFFLNKSGSSWSPQADQGTYSFFGPVEKGSPKKAGRGDQTLLSNGERSRTSGAEDSSVAICPPFSPAVGILPVLPQCGILPLKGAASIRHSACPRGPRGPEPALSSGTLPSKKQQPRVSRCKRSPVQSLHGHQVFASAGKASVRSEIGTCGSTQGFQYSRTTKQASPTPASIHDLHPNIPMQQRRAPAGRSTRPGAWS
uniref:alpha-tubulin N-acetyltransferase 1 isoform X3 n=1 Tax=Doryrhamphus excisus TaxID=161450 RepID=UPI0025AEA2B6|nr:alpha-tubulin N-acetyltransferase 1 isoform X3 [Doryrhamphus excisus]